MAATAKLALRYPVASDADDVPGDMQRLAGDVEASLSASGLLAARPAAAKEGRFYRATDTAQVFRDTGSGWEEMLSKAAADAAYLLRSEPQYAVVETAQSTGSTAPADLSTLGPSVTVTVPASGKVRIEVAVTAFNSTAGAYSYAGVALSGANTVAALNLNSTSLVCQSDSAGQRQTASRAWIVSGLTAGSTTFRMKYSVDSSTLGSSTFQGRTLIVTPL